MLKNLTDAVRNSKLSLSLYGLSLSLYKRSLSLYKLNLSLKFLARCFEDFRVFRGFKVFRVLNVFGVFKEFLDSLGTKKPETLCGSGLCRCYAVAMILLTAADFLESELLSDFLRHSVLVDKDVHCLVSNESL